MTTTFAPLSTETLQPIRLAMQRLWLAGRILPAGAHLTVQHVFRSEEAGPLEIIYSFALPRDAALRAFRITGDGFEVHSELKPTEEAVKIYESGIAQGSLATLARQYGDGVVNLTVGNIRPQEEVTVWLEILAGVELHDDGYRFRFPFTLAPGYHAQMRTVETDGEGEFELPADQFGDVILPRFRRDASVLHAVGFDLSLSHQSPVAEAGSPSHAIRLRQDRVSLAPERDIPNRDLVLDIRYQNAEPQILAGTAGESRRALAAIVPSTAFGSRPNTPRRVAILLDRSGSMQGAPIAQARKAIEACLATLEETDTFSLLAFDNRVETLAPALLPGTRENRDHAAEFLNRVEARGGTELAAGVVAAAHMLPEGGDIVILTDGQVSGTEQILARARECSLRLFCLGIGSASQDRFLSLLARETGGVSRFVTPRERVDMAALDLFASMGRPVASGLQAAGAQPEPPSAVFAGTPLLLFAEVDEPAAAFEIAWQGGHLSLPIPPGDPATGRTVRLLQGSRMISDWESRYPATEAQAPLEKRKQSRVAARLADLSQTYGLASREMCLVAVVQRGGDRPGALPETRVVPVGMPQDTRFEAYFPSPMLAAPLQAASFQMAEATGMMGAPLQRRKFALFGMGRAEPTSAPPSPPRENLVDLAILIEPDGGMPGATPSHRAARTIAALLAFLAEGHTAQTGAFRAHVARLVSYLAGLHGLPDSEQRLIDRVLRLTGAPSGPWLHMAHERSPSWKKLESALRA